MKSNLKGVFLGNLGYLLALIALLLLPFIRVGLMSFIMNLIIMACIYICLAESWNVLAGFCGLMSMGHCAFFGIGAYVTILVILKLGLSLWLSILISAACSVVVAYLIGAISIRVKDIFFALVTLALAQLLYSLSMQWVDVTRGPRGLIMPPVYNLTRVQLYYIALALVVIYVVIMAILRRSKIGTKLISLRENEMLSQSLGVNTAGLKIIATIISAVMASVVGSFYVLYVRSVQPSSVFTFSITMKIMIVAFIGGKGDVKGPILGGLIIIVDELIRGWLGGTYAGLPGVIYGLILVIFVLFMPNGLVSIFVKQYNAAVQPVKAKEMI